MSFKSSRLPQFRHVLRGGGELDLKQLLEAAS